MACVPRFLRAFQRRCGGRLSGQDFQDLVQEAHFQVLKSLPRYAGEAALETWVFRICGRVYFRHLERLGRGPEGKPPGDLLQVPDPSPPSLPDDPEERLEPWLRHLTERERAVVFLRFVLEMSLEEIAETMGIAVSTVRTLLQRALQKLRGILPPGDESPNSQGDE